MKAIELQRISTAIIELLADEDERLLNVDVGTNAAKVATTHGGWRVALAEAPRDDLTIVAATTAVVDARAPIHYFGILPDGRILPLAEPEPLGEYVAGVEPPLSPLQIALLVAEHVDSTGPPRFVVSEPEELRGGPAVDAPRKASSDDAGIHVEVDTYTWHYIGDDEADEKRFERWRIEVDPSGGLAWARVPLR